MASKKVHIATLKVKNKGGGGNWVGKGEGLPVNKTQMYSAPSIWWFVSYCDTVCTWPLHVDISVPQYTWQPKLLQLNLVTLTKLLAKKTSMLTESMLRLVHIVPSGAEGTLKILGLHVALVLTITIITGNQLFHTCIRRYTFKEGESFLIRMLGQYICIHTFIT